MKIVDKITLLVVFLLCVLAANTFTGLTQIAHIRAEFSAMAACDVGFMEAVTSVEQNQLAQGVLTQKLISIAEELGFEQVSFARRQYLTDQLKSLQEGFGHYAGLILSDIAVARGALDRSMAAARDEQKRADLRRTLAGLQHIEDARKAYENIVNQMTVAVINGGFQLSLDDLDAIQTKDKAIAVDVRALLKDVQGFVRTSLDRARSWQEQAERTLRMVLIFSIVASILLALWIVRGIARPLRNLSAAARQVGRGDFSARLDTSSKDEIAAVAQAFNTMSVKLDELTKELEQKNTELASNLESIDRFVHTATHDILSPLTVIVGYAAYLEKHYGDTLDDKGRESLANIRKGAMRMNTIVKDLLAFVQSSRPAQKP